MRGRLARTRRGGGLCVEALGLTLHALLALVAFRTLVARRPILAFLLTAPRPRQVVAGHRRQASPPAVRAARGADDCSDAVRLNGRPDARLRSSRVLWQPRSRAPRLRLLPARQPRHRRPAAPSPRPPARSSCRQLQREPMQSIRQRRRDLNHRQQRTGRWRSRQLAFRQLRRPARCRLPPVSRSVVAASAGVVSAAVASAGFVSAGFGLRSMR